MATLVLTALGTAIGGPLGGALGALLGRQADQFVFGGGSRTGPRLKELAVTTSSYGQPVPRHFGRMRTAGTIIWATDLVEAKSKQGGGKGKPSTTTYSYSISFAVAVSSTPISAVRRVWADGKLLRGAAGDLKVGGSMRTYLGFGDDPVDPLIAADRGSDIPAFRDFAYVVFEDLQLADFGNRIPALTFEVIGEDDDLVRMDRLLPQVAPEEDGHVLPNARGLADEGGPISDTLAVIDQVYPLTVALLGDRVRLEARAKVPEVIPCLPEPLAKAGRGREIEREQSRGEGLGREPMALRYYDEARDYQPGVQRAMGPRAVGRESVLDLPATMSADEARLLANSNAHRARWRKERIMWRCGELDPAIRPGSVVHLPENPGKWLVRNWEWHEDGIELGLERLAPELDGLATGDAGSAGPTQDQAVPETILTAFELPPDGALLRDTVSIYAAASASNSAWRGATLFIEQGDSLAEIGKTGPVRATMGTLASPLPPSQFHVVDQAGLLEVDVSGEDTTFPSTDLAGIATGANRVLVGDEVLQYLCGERVGATRWNLKGLLRGRAGTEHEALEIHPAGRSVVLLDDALIALDPARVTSSPTTRIAAVGRADADPIYALLNGSGSSRRPLSPVHPWQTIDADGGWTFGWTRRARGQWRWDEGVEVPLVEEREEYLVGYGPESAAHTTWLVETASFALSSSSRAALLDSHGAGNFWVKQSGTFALSPPLFLGRLP